MQYTYDEKSLEEAFQEMHWIEKNGKKIAKKINHKKQ